MATHFSVLAWRISGTGEPGGLPSVGSHRVGQDWSDLAAAAAALSSKTFPNLITFLPSSFSFSSVQSLSRVRLFATPWIAALQASLSITNSRSLLKVMFIELVMPSSHLILCRPLLLLPQSLPASESFPVSQLFAWGGQSTGVSIFIINTLDWSALAAAAAAVQATSSLNLGFLQ